MTLLAVQKDHAVASMVAATNGKVSGQSGGAQASIIQECFSIALTLAQPLPVDAFAPTHAQLRQSLDALLTQPMAWGFASDEAKDVAYAVCALADELALKGSPQLAQYWLPRRLQLTYFDDNMAGEGFFQRLDALRNEPGRHRILQTYYIALALGFEGRYGRQGGANEIVALMASIHQTLLAQASAVGGALSAHALPHDPPQAARPTLAAPWATVAGFGAVSALVYAVLWWHLRASSGAALAAIVALFHQLGP